MLASGFKNNNLSWLDENAFLNFNLISHFEHLQLQKKLRKLLSEYVHFQNRIEYHLFPLSSMKYFYNEKKSIGLFICSLYFLLVILPLHFRQCRYQNRLNSFKNVISQRPKIGCTCTYRMNHMAVHLIQPCFTKPCQKFQVLQLLCQLD